MTRSLFDPMKTCIKCKQLKPLTEFYAHPQMADGHLNKCKECCKTDNTKNRNEKISQYRGYDRRRAMLPHRVSARAIYQETHWGQHVETVRQWRKRNPEKYKAHSAVRAAIKSGTLVPQPCKCGELNVHAHHHDYSKPLEVTWLCPKCHKAEHAAGPTAIAA